MTYEMKTIFNLNEKNDKKEEIDMKPEKNVTINTLVNEMTANISEVKDFIDEITNFVLNEKEINLMFENQNDEYKKKMLEIYDECNKHCKTNEKQTLITNLTDLNSTLRFILCELDILVNALGIFDDFNDDKE